MKEPRISESPAALQIERSYLDLNALGLCGRSFKDDGCVSESAGGLSSTFPLTIKAGCVQI